MIPSQMNFLLFFVVGCTLASATSSAEGTIFVYNEGTYNAKFSVSYDLKGEPKLENTKELQNGENQFISIPNEAANVHLKVEKLGLKGFQTLFIKDFKGPPQKCYKLNGTLLSSGYIEISCSNVKEQHVQNASESNEIAEVGGQILIVDNAETPVHVALSYDLNGKKRYISDTLILGVNVKINIQKDATNVQLTIGGTFKQNFPGPVTKCYSVSGTGPNLKVEETACSSKVEHSWRVKLPKTVTDDAGYITVENSSGFLITFSVSYDLNGITVSASSGDLSAGIKKTIPIPSEATNIRLDLKQYLFPGSVTTVFSRAFQTSVKKCYKFTAFGIIPCPAVDEVRNSKKEGSPQSAVSIGNDDVYERMQFLLSTNIFQAK